MKSTILLHKLRLPFHSLVPATPGPLRRLAIVLVSLVLLLVVVGVMMVQSAGQVVAIAGGTSPVAGLLRQGAYALIGLAAMVGLSRASTGLLRRVSWGALLVGFTLQILVYTQLGYVAGGNRNWLRLGPLSMQPSELMKFVFLIWISTVIANKQQLMSRWWHVVVPIVPVVAMSMFINVLGGDLGTLMVLTGLVFGCLYFSKVPLRILAGLGVFAALGIGVMTLIKPNRVFRVKHFLETHCLTDTADAYGMCWQTLNGFWALAHGGIFGTGLGGGKSKWLWLPEAETDFVFAIIGEELGLIGAVGVIALFTVLLLSLVAALAHCQMLFTRSVLGGVTAWVGVQMIINVSVVLGFVPVLGVPLPIISAGGTSLISLLMAVGVVLSCLRAEAAAQENHVPHRFVNEREVACSRVCGCLPLHCKFR